LAQLLRIVLEGRAAAEFASTLRDKNMDNDASRRQFDIVPAAFLFAKKFI